MLPNPFTALLKLQLSLVRDGMALYSALLEPWLAFEPQNTRQGGMAPGRGLVPVRIPVKVNANTIASDRSIRR
ncbi:MAG: hypothetical protein IPK66_15275 [Rhodospirillales bacterium]|nr:hypothetical protein [Rhodospirillales bacterium]